MTINDHDYASRLKSEPAKWQQLCAAMDALEDTAMGIAVFSDLSDTDHAGELYLRTYGLLQCMFVQQDAVQAAANVLGVDCEIADKLHEIRDLRNATIGHPTNKTSKGEKGSFGIVQVSLSASRFQWHTFDLERWKEGGWPRPVVFSEIVEEQEEAVCDEIDRLIVAIG